MTEQQLFALLDQALPARVFQALAPQGTPEPYLVYALIDGTENNVMTGSVDLARMNYRIDSYARSHQDALAIWKRVCALVNACDGDPLLEGRQDMYEQDTRIHRVSIVLSTWYHEPDEVQP
ncbi:hypothetical protein HDG32_005517 [Paraburkholderia sp. CI2]|uniref:tail completion protein gp17 n=1 Tax=Paraburkholderia sp. CI2 TaxID=2723093 RepID=UPI00160C18D5|nr:DUF3168 domain-containing protein [Paraburkholderia sp. CI2]MBB5469370.1 hypothetical protein [Paraburkholderia sp. CI2]